MRNEIEVMRVLRVPPMGKLVVEVNQQRYEKLSEVPAENFKRLLLAAIGELIVFAGGYKNLVDAGVAPPVETGATQMGSGQAAVSATPAVQPVEQAQAKFLASLEAQRDTLKTTPSRPAPSLIGRQPVSSPSGATLSIVEQIDAILQQHIAADPTLAGRDIQLTQKPAGGVLIKVDGSYYEHPREIEDPKIQLLIKRALQEWEST